MADPLLPDKLDDFVNLTQAKVNRRSWVDLSKDLQKYYFAWMLHRKEQKMVSMEDGSHRLEWTIKKTNVGSFTDSEMYAKTESVQKDLTTKAFVDWTKSECNYIYDIDEPEFQRGPEKIIDIIDVRVADMYGDFYEGQEERMWTAPTSSTQRPRRPSGIPFWIQKAADTADNAAFGFNGGDPDGFSSGAGGVTVASVDNWKNGTFTYASLGDEDGIEKLVEACDKCYFMAPHSFAELDGGKPDYGFFTTYPVVQVLRRALRAQNDNLGPDIAAYRGEVILKGNPMVWVPALTNTDSVAYDSSNPIYGINWNSFDWFFQKSRNRYLTKPQIPDGRPTVRRVNLINWGNYRLTNRRSCFVGYDSTV